MISVQPKSINMIPIDGDKYYYVKDVVETYKLSPYAYIHWDNLVCLGSKIFVPTSSIPFEFKISELQPLFCFNGYTTLRVLQNSLGVSSSYLTNLRHRYRKEGRKYPFKIIRLTHNLVVVSVPESIRNLWLANKKLKIVTGNDVQYHKDVLRLDGIFIATV